MYDCFMPSNTLCFMHLLALNNAARNFSANDSTVDYLLRRLKLLMIYLTDPRHERLIQRNSMIEYSKEQSEYEILQCDTQLLPYYYAVSAWVHF